MPAPLDSELAAQPANPKRKHWFQFGKILAVLTMASGVLSVWVAALALMFYIASLVFIWRSNATRRQKVLWSWVPPVAWVVIGATSILAYWWIISNVQDHF